MAKLRTKLENVAYDRCIEALKNDDFAEAELQAANVPEWAIRKIANDQINAMREIVEGLREGRLNGRFDRVLEHKDILNDSLKKLVKQRLTEAKKSYGESLAQAEAGIEVSAGNGNLVQCEGQDVCVVINPTEDSSDVAI